MSRLSNKVNEVWNAISLLSFSSVSVQVADAYNKMTNTQVDRKWNRKSVVAVYLLTLLERMLETQDARMLEAGEHRGFAPQQLRHYLPSPRLVQLLRYSLLEQEDSCLLPSSQQQSSQYNTLFILLIYRDVKVSRPTWSRDHFFGLGLGLGLTVIGIGLGLGLMR